MALKHVAFDLDGVLIDALAIHRECFVQAWNESVPDSPIDDAYHDAHLASRNTVQKIHTLIERRLAFGYDFEQLLDDVSRRKQELTRSRIDEAQATVPWLRRLIESLRDDGRLIALVSNSIRSTCERTLANVGVLDLFDEIVASDDADAKPSKPHPEPYLAAAKRLGERSEGFVAFEDSPTGIRSARTAGCWIYVVSEPQVDLEIARVRAWLKVIDAV